MADDLLPTSDATAQAVMATGVSAPPPAKKPDDITSLLPTKEQHEGAKAGLESAYKKHEEELGGMIREGDEAYKRDRARMEQAVKQEGATIEELKHGTCSNPHCQYKHVAARAVDQNQSTTQDSDPALSDPQKAEIREKRLCFTFIRTKGNCARGDTCPFKHAYPTKKEHENHFLDRVLLSNTQPNFEVGETVVISSEFAEYDGVYATVKSHRIVKLKNGEHERVYTLDMPRYLADEIHPSFYFELTWGVQEKYLGHLSCLHKQKSCAHNEAAASLKATLDSASTIDMINTDRYFIPDSIRTSTVSIATNNPSQSNMQGAKSGLVVMKTAVPDKLIVRRMHYFPGALRTIISIPKLRDLGCTLSMTETKTTISKDGDILLVVDRSNNADDKASTAVDGDNYVPEFDVIPDEALVLPSDLLNVDFSKLSDTQDLFLINNSLKMLKWKRGLFISLKTIMSRLLVS